MNGLSEDDSSDSSSEYLVEPDKINLNSSFFAEKTTNITTPSRSDSDDESSDEGILEDVNEPVNIELFTQVLKNLENSQKLEVDSVDDVSKEPSTSDSSLLEKLERKELKIKPEINPSTSSVEINELLLQGETNITSPVKKVPLNAAVKNEDDAEGPSEYTIPKEGVKIILPGNNVIFKRKKKGAQDLKTILKRRLRASQILVEKVGLLCWLAYGFNLNRQINQPEIMTRVLSLISTCNYPKSKINLTYLEKFTKWFKHVFVIEDIESNCNKKIDRETLLEVLKEKKVSDYKELVLLYIAALRSLGLNCRLVISLSPPHRIFSDNPLFKLDSKAQESKSKANTEKKGNSKKRKGDKNAENSGTSPVAQNSPEAKKNANAEAKKRAAEILRSKSQNNSKRSRRNVNNDSGSKGEEAKKSSSSTNSTGKKDDPKVDNCSKTTSNLRQLRSRKVNTSSQENTASQSRDLSSVTDGTKSKYYMEESSSDSEAEFQPKSKHVAKKFFDNSKAEASHSSKNAKKNNRKLISSDSETEEGTGERKRYDFWAEVYLESEGSWICASVMDESIHCPTEVYKKARKPVLYVVAWNSVGTIKDVTRRYCPQWLTITRKQRVDEKWWQETLSYWKEKDSAISKAEDEMLLQRELEQPLPKTIGKCKGHPLYVIARHLLKFEGLYPPDCVPLGHTATGDAIYSRHCVHTLCSRETWLKKARVVKPNQEPYKIVKARPKYDKLSGMKIKDSALELFGEWQTMEYEPPVAQNGIVPRNEYGNVDLFKLCMLPKGTVHINLPGLNRVARKLNIDCAPAVVGFNFGSMGAVPALEGYVVCSEFEDTLREAWETEQAEAEKRAREKQEKRVYGNWKKLIQGLIIRERLAAKYEFSRETQSVASKRTKQKKTDAKKAKVS